ncbi:MULTISPECIES: hypothetical protein [Gordonia]|jgi:hypothetical protein|uniref:hypothetical protein n=1 Tax=Gordonia TaxID=2053 RepID=UPI0011121EA0|nr:hypothetical protein [Gordonia sp. UCD-TK1]
MMQLISFYEKDPVKTDDASVLQFPFTEASDYTFGNEPTIAKVIYVRHPRIEARLVPYGQYDTLVMTDKFNEALRIVQTLGAQTVVTKSFRGGVSRLSIRGRIPQAGGGSADLSRTTREEVAFEQFGTGGPPVDPGQSVYPDEAGFEAARRAVLLNGARRVAINIESQSAFRMDSDIANRLTKIGFSLGASAERTQVRLLRLEADFPEEGKLHSPDAGKLGSLVDPKEPLDPDGTSEDGSRRWRRAR